VAVAHPAIGDAPVKQGPPAPEVRLGEGARTLDVLGRHDPERRVRELVETLLPQPEHDGKATRLGDRRRGRRVPVEAGHRTRHPADEVRGVGGVEQGRKAPGVRHAAHGDQVVQCVPVLVDHVEHAEVDVGREAPVHLGLAPAGLEAVLAAAVVEEAHRDRLQQLVRAIADHRDHRNVRFDELARWLHGPILAPQSGRVIRGRPRPALRLSAAAFASVPIRGHRPSANVV